jgi:hypothetical protein
MHALRAQVKNGRLVMDEPTDLPEGSVVPLEISKDWDELDEEERTALHRALDEAEADVDAARTVSIEDVRSRLRAIR